MVMHMHIKVMNANWLIEPWHSSCLVSVWRWCVCDRLPAALKRLVMLNAKCRWLATGGTRRGRVSKWRRRRLPPPNLPRRSVANSREGDGGGGRPAPYWLIFFSQKAVFLRVNGIYFVVRICDKW